VLRSHLLFFGRSGRSAALTLAACLVSAFASVALFGAQPPHPVPRINHTGPPVATAVPPDKAAQARVVAAYGRLPLSFEANQGQVDAQVQFLSHGPGYHLFLTGNEAVLELQKAEGRTQKAEAKSKGQNENSTASGGDLLRMKLVGANQAAQVTGLAELPGKSNYFIGNDPKRWRVNVPNYAQVRYQHIYPGVDLIYYGNQQQLEYDFVVAPGADPSLIRIAIDADGQAGSGQKAKGSGQSGIQNEELKIESNGDLVIKTDGDEVRFRKPMVYQEEGSVRQPTDRSQQSEADNRQFLDGHFVLTGNHELAFHVGSYDHNKPLIIDPAVTYPTVSYSTYLGPIPYQGAVAIAVDSTGAAYLVGSTTSASFPVVNPLPAPNNALQGDQDAFVAKLNSTGTALVYSTYLGGTGSDSGSGIAVDSTGQAYITGATQSSDFPTLNAYQSALNGSSAAFVTTLNGSGNALVYSTYLSGSGTDSGGGIAFYSAGKVYVAGSTSSSNFPTTAGVFQATLAGSQNAFVAEIDTTQAGSSSLIASTYLGGAGYDGAVGIGVDSSGNTVVAGTTSSTNFPTLNPYQSSLGSAIDSAFVTKFSATLSAPLVYSTYLGGSYFNGPPTQSAYNIAKGIAVDSTGNAYVAGFTDAYDFPIHSNYQGSCSPYCTWDGFVAKFDPSGANLYATYFGGSTYQGTGIYGNQIFGIAADTSGNAYFTGFTDADNLPLMTPVQSVLGGGLTETVATDAFVSELNSAGSALVFSSYLGGTYNDEGTGVAVDSSGNIYVAGFAGSLDFPVIAGAFQTSNQNDSNDSFVARISDLTTPSMAVTPLSVTFAPQAGGTHSSPQTVLVHNVSGNTLAGASIAFGGTNGADFSETDTCASPVSGGTDCGISVTFTPSLLGPETATMTITASGAIGSPTTVTLNGTGASDGVASLSPTSLTFSNQPVGTTSTSQPVTLTNTGTGPLGSISITASSDFGETNNCPAILAVAAACTINVTFSPSAAGFLSETLTVSDDAANSPQLVSLNGTGFDLLSPTSLAFYPEAVGLTTPPQIVTLTNNSSAPLTINSISTTGDFAQTNNCPGTVAISATCTISVTFTPTADGSRSGTLVVNTGLGTVTMSLTGTGFVSRLTPTTLSFVAQTVATTSAIQTATLINTGATPLTITSATLTIGTNFAQTNTCANTVPAGGTCTFNFTFTPTAVGSISDIFTVVTNSPDSPQSMNLVGTGIIMSFSPQTLLFDNQGVGATSAPQTVTLTNTGTTAVTVSSITTSDSQFAQTNNCGTTIAAGASCSISVTFSPTSAGVFATDDEVNPSMTITSSAPDSPQIVSLLGVGESVTQSARLLFFAPQPIGVTSPPQTVTITNTQTFDETGVSFSTSGDFGQTNACGTTILAGASCTVSVTFTPTATGPRSGTLTVSAGGGYFQVIVGLFGASPIVNLPGFTTNVFGPNDDLSTSMVPLPFTVNFFGNQYNGLFVNNNGNVTFDTQLETYTPFDLTSTGTVIIGPFFADVDTGAWPNNDSQLVTYGTDTVNGHTAFGVNYFNVGYFDEATDKLNAFQLLLINRSDIAPGDFDIEFNYGQVQWETGDASGGSDGLGGASARVGFSNGTQLPNTFYEQPGSAVNGALLDTNTQTGLIFNSLNSSNLGQYIFNVRAGGVIPPGFAASTTSLTFPDTLVGQSSSPQTVTVSNTGGSSFTISSIATSPQFSQTNNCPSSLAPGATCTVNVVFSPTAAGPQTGTLTFTDTAPGSPQTVTLSGNGVGAPAVSLAPTSLTFASQIVGTTSGAQTVTLTNTGSGTLTITSIVASGDFAQTNTCGTSVAAGANCTISVTFTPTATGARTGTVTITDNASNSPQTISLSGTGVTPVVSLLPTSLTFANQIVGTTSAAQTVTLTNTGSAALAISSITVTGANPGDFAVALPGTPGPIACQLLIGSTLGAGASCRIPVTFTPTATGTRTGAVTITDDASGSPQSITLAGTGISGAAVTLSTNSLQLPDTHVNQTCQPGTVTLTSTGSAPVTISSITVSGQFTETNTCPASLAPGNSCAVTVTFAPTTTGAQTGTLTITSNAANSPNTVALSGNGLAPCFLGSNSPSSSVPRGVDTTTFTVAHQACSAVGTVQLSCTNQNPATCTFSPATVTAGQPSTLTLSNLKAVTGGGLSFQVHGDAALEHLLTNLSVKFLDFILTSAPSSQSVSAGQSATFALALAPQNGLTGSISLACTGAPQGATCNVSPPSVTFTDTNPANLTVTVTTTARSLLPPRGNWRVPGGTPSGPMGLVILALLASALAYVKARPWRPVRLRLAMMAAGLMVAMVATWAACGGGMAPQSSVSNATPSGSYNLIVTATYNVAGTDLQIVHNSTLQLTVH